MPKALGSIFSKTTKKGNVQSMHYFLKNIHKWVMNEVIQGYQRVLQRHWRDPALRFCLFLTLAVNHLGKQDGFSSSSIHWFMLLWLWKWIQSRLKETGRYFVLEGIWFHKRMKYASSLLCYAKNAFRKIRWNKSLI